MVELRKRKPAAEASSPPPAKKSSNPIKKAVDAAKEAVTGSSATTNGSSAKIAVGQTIPLEGFGGELETHSGEKVTLHQLVEKSQSGVVLFTYPKANTPGCTTQACLFRDNYTPITGHGLLVYGLSTDSPKSNTTFATKQSLPFPLLCDPSASLTGAIGMKKPPKSTTRGVVIVDKQGTVKVWEQAGPQKTVDAVMAYIQSSDPTTKEAVAGVVGGNDTKMEEAPASTDAHAAVVSTEAAPTTDTEMMPPTNSETMPAASSEMAPTENAAPAPTEIVTATETMTGGAVSGGFAASAPENVAPLARADTQPHTDEIPITKFPSGEEMRSADTAAEVSESAAKVDSPEMEKAPIADLLHTA